MTRHLRVPTPVINDPNARLASEKKKIHVHGAVDDAGRRERRQSRIESFIDLDDIIG